MNPVPRVKKAIAEKVALILKKITEFGTLPRDYPVLQQITARLTLKSPNLHSDADFHLLL